MNKTMGATGGAMIGAVVLTALLPWWILVAGGGALVYGATKVEKNNN